MSKFSSQLSGFAFVSEPLERADTLRDDADALLRLWPDARVLVLDQDGTALAGHDGQPLPLTGADLGGGPGTAIFLGLRGEQAWFSMEAAGLSDRAWLVQYAAMPGQTVTPLAEADCEKQPYFSIVVVHGQGRRP